jgi:hypothetical protein
MVKAARAFAPGPADAAVNSLRIQGIGFRGPLYTPGKQAVFFVESYILLESELADVFAQNKLNRDGIQALVMRIEAVKCSKSQCARHALPARS